jgi:Predicted glycosyl hydrolase
MLLAALCFLQLVPKAAADTDYGCSAWLTYWDADAALQEVRELPDAFESLICFEVYFDVKGNWILPPESEQLLRKMQESDTPVYLSLVNDVQQEDGSFVQKSRDFLEQQLTTSTARSAHIVKIMQLIRSCGVKGVEIDYENFKENKELWSAFTEFLEQLYGILRNNGIALRVVMECGAPKYAEFPEGPIYSCMCYNLYGYHSGPGPKADKAFLEEVGENWKSVPGEVHMAFATGGFLWTGNTVEKALTEQDAQTWLEQQNEKPKRDKESGALKAVIFGDKKQTVWYADGETLHFWRDTLRAMGYTHFDLFRLGGNVSGSLAEFVGTR